jgi:hypothetical protein
MVDIVINHRIGSTRGIGDLYKYYDGMPMPWDEHVVTCDSHTHPFPLEIEAFTQILHKLHNECQSLVE